MASVEGLGLTTRWKSTQTKPKGVEPKASGKANDKQENGVEWKLIEGFFIHLKRK